MRRKHLQHRFGLRTYAAVRRGVTALIAMLYLVLATTLALGFYAVTATSAQISANEEQTARSYLAAESGMDFMRRAMAKVRVPPNTAPETAINFYYPGLQSQLDGTENLNGGAISRTGNTIYVPASGYVKLDAAGNARFKATITDWAGELVVKIEGFYGSSTVSAQRTITMDFSRQKRNTTTFNYAIASKGQVVASKGEVTGAAGVDPKIAAVMSASATSNSVVVSGGKIGGDVSIVDGASVSISGGSVGGSSVPSVIMSDHVHEVDPPEFPTLDPTVFRTYATNNYSGSKNTQSNIYIAPNTNPTFNGNNTVQGIMYIASPNKVKFNGNFTLQGFIVMEQSASTTDLLDFSGNVTMSALPNQPQFDALRSVSGVAVMAPGATMTMTGSSSSLRGNILVNKFSMNGAAGVQIDAGTLMTFHEGNSSAVFNSSKSIKFTSTGAGNQPSLGVKYSEYYSAKPATYQEITP